MVFVNFSTPDFHIAFTRLSRGGEKLTRVHENDVADQHFTLAVKRNDAHVCVSIFPVLVVYLVYSLGNICNTKCPSYDDRL